MKECFAIQVPFLSFYSKGCYRAACFDWKGTGFAYLFLLLAICWIPATVKFHIIFSDFIRKDAQAIINQIPQITVSHGIASVDAAQPYFIKAPKTQKVLVVIDTTGKINDLKNTEALGLITKNEAIFKKSAVETQSFNYKNIDHLVLNQQEAGKWSEIARRYVALIFYPFAVIGSFVFRIVQILIYAAIGILLASWCGSKRSYDSLLRLSTVAVTPGIIINTLLGIAQIRVPFAALWFFLIAMVYLFIGVRECAKDIAQPGDSTAATF